MRRQSGVPARLRAILVRKEFCELRKPAALSTERSGQQGCGWRVSQFCPPSAQGAAFEVEESGFDHEEEVGFIEAE